MMKTLKFGRPGIGWLRPPSWPLRWAAGTSAPKPAHQSPGPSLPLSMSQAVAMALEANLGLKVERLNLDVASHSMAIAKAAFLPQVQAERPATVPKSVPSDFTQGVLDIVEQRASLSGQVRQETAVVRRWLQPVVVGQSIDAGRRDSRVSIPASGRRCESISRSRCCATSRPTTCALGSRRAERRRAISDIQLRAARGGHRSAGAPGLSESRRRDREQEGRDDEPRHRGAVTEPVEVTRQGRAVAADRNRAGGGAGRHRRVRRDCARKRASDGRGHPSLADPRSFPPGFLAGAPGADRHDSVVAEGRQPRRGHRECARQPSRPADRAALARHHGSQHRAQPQHDPSRRRSQRVVRRAGTGGTQFTFGPGFPPPITLGIDQELRQRAR